MFSIELIILELVYLPIYLQIWMWWFSPVTPALLRLRSEDLKFKILEYIMRP
jgi:hypothetical protein